MKKAQAAERKAQRDANKEKYGYATVDGQRMELGNYNVEPNSIFMGRGQHPWRGRWKQGSPVRGHRAQPQPRRPRPAGRWKAIVWEPGTMWTRRLDGQAQRQKEVRLGPATQASSSRGKDMAKYEKARGLKERLDEVKAHIESTSPRRLKRRKTATVCYLIDRLKFRVGGEKDDEDEADTVGACTLRPEHVCFNGDGSVTFFDFLGKDSVQMDITAPLPPKVVGNLRDFASGCGEGEPLRGHNSGHVGDFLKEVMEGLSAKVFRTLYATDAVGGRLAKEIVKPEDPDYVKRQAALRANLEAAIV